MKCNICFDVDSIPKGPYSTPYIRTNGIEASLKIVFPLIGNKRFMATIMLRNCSVGTFSAIQHVCIINSATNRMIEYKKKGDFIIEKNGTGSKLITFTQTVDELRLNGYLSNKTELSLNIIPSMKICSPTTTPLVLNKVQLPGVSYRAHQKVVYDSYQETGYVGLMNLSATCYMNSVLQMLFHLPLFRQLIYSLDVSKSVSDPRRDVILNLQLLFSEMQRSKTPVNTKSLTVSFGWDDQTISQQHDTTEFWLVLIDKLKEKLKGDEVSYNQISELFTIKQEKIAFSLSSNINSILGSPDLLTFLPVHIQGFKSVNDAINSMLQPFLMDGSININGESYDDVMLQMTFSHLPTILMIQLMRFEFDGSHRIKLNHKVEFPKMLELPSNEEPSIIYTLHGVLCHHGSANGGHYTAFLRPTIDEKWFEFNDTHVKVVTTRTAIENNYDGSGYFLLYVRLDKENDIYRPISQESIPERIISLSNLVQLEYSKIIILSELLLISNSEKFICGISENDSDQSIYISIMDSCETLYKKFADYFGMPKNSFRIWNTNKCGRPMSIIKECNSNALEFIGVSRQVFFEIHENTHDTNILFLKYFDPIAPKMSYIGSLCPNEDSTIESLLPLVNNHIGSDITTNLLCFIEIDICSVKQIELNTLLSSLPVGSILVFQTISKNIFFPSFSTSDNSYYLANPTVYNNCNYDLFILVKNFSTTVYVYSLDIISSTCLFSIVVPSLIGLCDFLNFLAHCLGLPYDSKYNSLVLYSFDSKYTFQIVSYDSFVSFPPGDQNIVFKFFENIPQSSLDSTKKIIIDFSQDSINICRRDVYASNHDCTFGEFISQIDSGFNNPRYLAYENFGLFPLSSMEKSILTIQNHIRIEETPLDQINLSMTGLLSITLDITPPISFLMRYDSKDSIETMKSHICEILGIKLSDYVFRLLSTKSPKDKNAANAALQGSQNIMANCLEPESRLIIERRISRHEPSVVIRN